MKSGERPGESHDVSSPEESSRREVFPLHTECFIDPHHFQKVDGVGDI